MRNKIFLFSFAILLVMPIAARDLGMLHQGPDDASLSKVDTNRAALIELRKSLQKHLSADDFYDQHKATAAQLVITIDKTLKAAIKNPELLKGEFITSLISLTREGLPSMLKKTSSFQRPK